VLCGERPTNKIKTNKVNIDKISHNINGICNALGKISVGV
jgi:hypothetical protein